jgi:CcmD family protein
MENNLGYLIAAFAAVWIGIAAYVAWVGAQTTQLRRDVAALREQLSEDEGKGSG